MPGKNIIEFKKQRFNLCFFSLCKKSAIPTELLVKNFRLSAGDLNGESFSSYWKLRIASYIFFSMPCNLWVSLQFSGVGNQKSSGWVISGGIMIGWSALSFINWEICFDDALGLAWNNDASKGFKFFACCGVKILNNTSGWLAGIVIGMLDNSHFYFLVGCNSIQRTSYAHIEGSFGFG